MTHVLGMPSYSRSLGTDIDESIYLGHAMAARVTNPIHCGMLYNLFFKLSELKLGKDL